MNDDFSGLDSRFSWKNTTGFARLVTLRVFAYSAASAGKVTLNPRLKTAAGLLGPLGTVRGYVLATAVSGNLPTKEECREPSGSVIELKRVFGGGFGAGLMRPAAINDRRNPPPA